MEEKDGELVGTGEFKNTYDVDVKKTQLIEVLKSNANKLLSSTDWQVVRKAERDIPIDDDVISAMRYCVLSLRKARVKNFEPVDIQAETEFSVFA